MVLLIYYCKKGDELTKMTENIMRNIKNTVKRSFIVQRIIDEYPTLTNNDTVNQYFERFGIEQGDIVIDFGANVGDVTAYFARKGCNVYAYEPNPTAFNKLYKRFKRYNNVKCIRKAVGNKNGAAQLYLWTECPGNPLMNSVGSSLRGDKSDVSSKHVTVDVLEVKNIICELDKIKLIKMDIEGAEYDVLPELFHFSDRIEFVVCETHQHLLPGSSTKHAELEEEIKYRNLGDRWFLDWH